MSRIVVLELHSTSLVKNTDMFYVIHISKRNVKITYENITNQPTIDTSTYSFIFINRNLAIYMMNKWKR